MERNITETQEEETTRNEFEQNMLAALRTKIAEEAKNDK